MNEYINQVYPEKDENLKYNKFFNKIILGGGIAGLIAGFYLNLPVICEKVGGHIRNHYNLGSVYLYVNEFTKKLLNDLEIRDASIKVIKVGYKDAEVVCLIPPQGFKESYAKKTQRLTSQSGLMSSGISEFEVYDIDLNSIIFKLYSKVQIINAKVLRIDGKNKIIITDKGIYGYDKLISTIPLPEFFKCCSLKDDLKYSAVTFAITDAIIDLKDCDYIYVMGDIYYRVSQYSMGDTKYQCFEFLGSLSEMKVRKILKVKELLDYKVLPCGKILQSPPNLNFANVEFIGRFAEFDSSVKIHTVIEKVLEIKKNEI